MNKIDSDELEIEDNVIDIYTEDDAKTLFQKLTETVRDNLSPENYTPEGVAAAIQLIKETFLDDSPLKNFADNIKQKMQEKQYTPEEYASVVILIKHGYVHVTDIIGDWVDPSFLPNIHQNELAVKLLKDECIDDQIVIQKSIQIKQKLKEYTQKDVDEALDLIKQKYRDATDIETKWSGPSFLPNSSQIDLAVKFVEAKFVDQKIIRTKSIQIQQKIQEGTYKTEDIRAAISFIKHKYLDDEQVKKISDKIRQSWSSWKYNPPISEIEKAATLAEEGYITNILNMNLQNVDISGINMSHLTRTVTDTVRMVSVTGNIYTILHNITNNRHLVLKNIDMSGVNIPHNITLGGGILYLDNIRGNIGSLLENVKCGELYLDNMTLDSETTRSLVHCARENVKEIVLGCVGLLTLDMNVFTGYNMNGTCQEIWCHNKTKEKYGDRMTTWARNNGLEVYSDSGCIYISRR